MSLEIIEQFLRESAYSEDYADNTLLSYRQDLLQCAEWLEKNGKHFMNVDHSMLTSFLMHRNRQGLSFTSITRAMYTFRSFFKYLHQKGLRTDDPSILLEKPRIWQLLPEVLTPEEIEAMVSVDISKKESHNVRNRAVIQVLYGCGLRISELLNLKIEDIRLPEKMILCLGKGKKERWVPFNARVQSALIEWLHTFRPLILKKFKSHFVFIGNKKNVLTRQYVWFMLQKISVQAGIHKRIYPHIFRHSYATHILAGGGDLRIVQELLGHADISTTQKYTHIEKNKLIEKHKLYHPRA